MPTAGRAALVLIFLLPGIATGRELWSLLRDAAAIRRLPLDERRRAVYGDWTRVTDHIRATVPPAGAVDMVMLTPNARELAVFAGVELGLRDVRFFDGWDAWRSRDRARFMNDVRAVNAPPGPPPDAARVVVTVDTELRIVSSR